MRTAQAPIGSGFGRASTAADVIKGIDLVGSVGIVTGGYAIDPDAAEELWRRSEEITLISVQSRS